eukprot:5874947-Alexandrium_andersonii.AAC.1
MSSMPASSMPMMLSGFASWRPSAVKSNTATPRPSRSRTCQGTGCPSLACWVAIPRRMAAQSVGG